MNTIIESHAVQRIRRHRATGATSRRRAHALPAIAARKRASEALGRSALVFLMGAGFALGAVLPLKGNAAPFDGSPIEVPAVIPAKNFDRGGEGVGYHDKSPGNAGGVNRPAENVDIIMVEEHGPVVNNFQTGEWLAYTIKVPQSDKYDIELRASTTFSDSEFRVEIGGTDITGPITVPNTGGWSTFAWTGKKGVTLAAGTHVLKVFSNRQYFNLLDVRVKRTANTPYFDEPHPVPGTIRSERFDRGGEGIAYHDKNAGNSGKAFRKSEDVDIIEGDGNFVVNSFKTGEWLIYTVDVARTAQYDIALRVSSASSTSAFRVDLGGVNRTGTVKVPNTGGWDTFRWVTKKGVTLPKGRHELKVIASEQYFNLSTIRITETETEPAPGSNPPQTGNRQFFCTFQSSPSECGFGIQAKSNSRASIVSGGRDGGTAVRLRTEPGDNNVFGSGSSERADLSLSQGNTDCSQGKEAWWAHSVMFPGDYVSATDGFGVAMDFHHTGSSGQANFHLDTSRWDGLMRFRGYGGSQDANEYGAVIGSVVKNQWYDFVYHVRWSSGSDGFMRAWVNGKKKLDHSGPTLYSGQGCYLKLANYHSPFGEASAVIHDRVIRGSTWQAVSRTTLEGVQ